MKNTIKKIVCYVLILMIMFSTINTNLLCAYAMAPLQSTVSQNSSKVVSENTAMEVLPAETAFNLMSDEGAAQAEPMSLEVEYSDFTPYLTSHTLEVDGKEIKSGDTIDPSKEFSLSISFVLNLAQMAKDGLFYQFKLPEHISIGDQGSAQAPLTLYNASRVAIGTYFIKDDVIYVEYPGYYDVVTTNFSLNGSWSGTENKLSIEVPWKDGAEVYNINPCELMITKKSTGYVNGKDGSLTNIFTVEVRPKSGTGDVSGISIEDVFESGYLQIVDDYYSNGNEYKVTCYAEDTSIIKEEFFDYADVSAKSGKKVTTKIDNLSIEDGGYLTLQYATTVPAHDRMLIDATNKWDVYNNDAKASYKVLNPDTGKEQELFVSTSISGKYETDSEWIFKSADKIADSQITSAGTSVVPYTLNINKHRRYSLGGSSVNDEITNFVGGDVKYLTGSSADPWVEVINSKGNQKVDQTWIVLSDDVYTQFRDLVYKSGADTSLERFRNNAAVLNAVLAELNAQTGESATEFTDEMALTYVFTNAASHNFVWLMPMDTEPTNYLIHYDTLVEQTVGEFKNTASMWYTDMEGVPEGPGIGWTRPVKKVLNGSKTNEGVYVGADGNYYVDYTITAGVEAGSAAFDDIILFDTFPKWDNVPLGGNNYRVIDWLVGLERDEISCDSNITTNAKQIEAFTKCFKISSTSTDPAVQEVVERAYVNVNPGAGSIDGYRDRYAGQSAWSRIEQSSYPYLANSVNTKDRLYTDEEALHAGQLVADQNDSRGYYQKGDTGTIGRVFIYLGPLPATDVGYDIVIKYTMQVNPALVKALPQMVSESNPYIQTENEVSFNTTYIDDYGREEVDREIAVIDKATTSYWLGMENIVPGLNKGVVTYDETNDLLNYEIIINPNDSIVASPASYEITDMLSVSGMKYQKNSFTLKDSSGQVIWSNVLGVSAHTSYADYASLVSLTCTESDSASNEFKMVLNNATDKFKDSADKLMKMTLTYSVDLSGYPTDIDIVNAAGLMECGTQSTGNKPYQVGLGESTSEFSVDKTLDKKLKSNPTSANKYKATYEVEINPNSANAKQLKELQVGESFTVRDTMNKGLVLDIDNVKVSQNVNGVSADITDQCQLKYDRDTGVFDTVITVSDKNATYRITYDTSIDGQAGGYVRLVNTVEILGTDITKEVEKDDVIVKAFTESASAYTMKINLIKYDQNNFDKRLKATFDLYEYVPDADAANRWKCLSDDPDNGYDRITTDENGKATIENKVLSSVPIEKIKEDTWYKLVEAEAENGYIASKEPIYYYVSKDGTVKVPFNTKTSTILTLAPIGANESEVPLLYISNERFGFDLEKIDAYSKESVKGAEFTLYTDEACTQAIATAKDEDKDGKLSFDDVVVPDTNGIVYMKETKVPAGYIDKGEVYTLNLTNGYVTAVSGSEGSVVTVNNDSSRSALTVPNYEQKAYLEISKTISYTSYSSNQKFPFVITLKDAAGNELTGEYPAEITGENSDRVQINTYKSGNIVYLMDEQQLLIKELPAGATYSVKEVPDNNYKASYCIHDNSTDHMSRYEYSQPATGTLEAGNRDLVMYRNEPNQILEIQKEMVDDNGNSFDLHNGYTIEVYLEDDIICRAKWSEMSAKFYTSYIDTTKCVYDDSNPNVVCLRGLGVGDYYIREKNADRPGYQYGVTYSGTDKDEKISLEYYDLRKKVKLTNTYTTNYALQTLQAEKKLTDKTLTKGAFDFELYRLENSNSKLDYTTKIDAVSNAADGTVKFKPIAYTAAGTYHYAIKEVVPENAVLKQGNEYLYQGIVYDATPIYVTVEVTEDADGKISATSPVYSTDYDGTTPVADPEITNRYEPVGDIVFAGTKSMKDGSAVKKAFDFTIKQMTDSTYTTVMTDAAGDEITYAGTNKDAAAQPSSVITFDKITYGANDIGKTYYYIVTEDIPADADADNKKNGVIYDGNSFKVSVEITDNGDGTLTATPTYVDGVIEFVNDYEASGSLPLSGTKEMTGMDLKKDQFEFVLTEYTSSSRTTIKKDASGKEIIYKFSHDAATMNNGVAVSDIKFPTLQYTYKDVGIHYYDVKETIPSDAVSGVKDNIQYDTNSYDIIVTVIDNGDGTLSVTANKETDLDFENSWSAHCQVAIDIEKIMNGRAMADGEFAIMLQPYMMVSPDGTTQPWMPYPYLLGYTKADGSVNYNPVYFQYTQQQAGWKMIYLIGEYAPQSGTQGYVPGVTYSSATYVAEVSVNKVGEMDIEATIQYFDYATGASVSKMTFINEYDAKGSVTFEATKLLTGKTIKADQFRFGIYEGDKLVSEGTNDVNGKITFAPIDFYIDGTQTGTDSYIGTHDYVVKEILPAAPEAGVVYDKTTYDIKVTAADNGDGTLDIKVDAGAKASAAGLTYEVTVPNTKKANFENHYEAKGSFEFAGTKELIGSALKDQQFTFTAKEFRYENGVRKETGRTFTGKNDASGKVSFDPIEYQYHKTQYDTGTWEYEICEDIPNTAANGITYDTTNKYVIKVMVADKGDGTLDVLPELGYDTMKFVNTYGAKGSFRPEGKKMILNAEKVKVKNKLPDGAFTFTVTEYINATMMKAGEGGQKVATGKSKKDGTIKFDEIQYGLSDAGMHYYAITEDDKTLPWVINTDIPVYVQVKVKDNGDGTMSVEAKYEKENKAEQLAEFENETTEIIIRKTDSEGKLLAGATLEIKDETGKTIYTYTSDGKKPEKIYGLSREKKYVLHEAQAPDHYMVAKDISFYIDTEGNVIVDKKSVNEIKMVDEHISTVTTTSSSQTNTSKRTTPKTGDNSNPAMMLVMLLASFASLLVLLGIKRRQAKK